MVPKIRECPWEEINGFESSAEFERFQAWLKETVADGNAEEVPVLERYQEISSLVEEWYRHIDSHTLWRLLRPDPPFTGLFKRIKP